MSGADGAPERPLPDRFGKPLGEKSGRYAPQPIPELAKALWYCGAGRLELRNEALRLPGPDECLVEACWSGISPGTERLVYGEQVPEEAYEAMRGPHMGGRFPYPVKYGYSLVGRVLHGPDSLVGRRVHVLHPHQTHCTVPAADVFPVPDAVPSARATLASNLETAVTIVWDARASIGDRLLLVGFGAVGSLVARLLRDLPGLDLTVADVSEERRSLASGMGFSAAEPGAVAGEFDVAINTSGRGEGLQLGIDRLGTEGRMVEASWHGRARAALALGGAFHYRRQRIASSQVSRIPGERAPRWDHRRRKALVFRLLERQEFDAHIGRVLHLEALPRTLMPWLREARGELAGVVCMRDDTAKGS